MRAATTSVSPAPVSRRSPALPASTGRSVWASRSRRTPIWHSWSSTLPSTTTRDKFNEVEALSGWKFNDALRGDDIVPAAVGGGGFIGCDALDQDGSTASPGSTPSCRHWTVPRRRAHGHRPGSQPSSYCLLTGGFVWGDGNILLGGGGSDSLEGRGANDIIDGDHYVNVRLSVARPAVGSRSASTDLMEHAALSGTFGAAPPMTLSRQSSPAMSTRDHLASSASLADATSTATSTPPSSRAR